MSAAINMRTEIELLSVVGFRILGFAIQKGAAEEEE